MFSFRNFSLQSSFPIVRDCVGASTQQREVGGWRDQVAGLVLGQLVGFYLAVNCLFCFTGGTMPSQLSMESPTASKDTAALQGFTVFRFSSLVGCNFTFQRHLVPGG